MIGIGITTYNRNELLFECVSRIEQHTKNEYKLFVAHDSDIERMGVAYRKNQCLSELRDCEHIFLFDDDCYPIKNDWDSYVISIAEKTNNNHFCYNKEPFCKIHQSMIINGEIIDCYNASGGVFLYYSKSAIEKVGAFYSGYEVYGHEHIGHSIRIHRANLTCDFFPCPNELHKYIHSLDYEEDGFFINKSTIPFELKQAYYDLNSKIWKEKDQNIYISF